MIDRTFTVSVDGESYQIPTNMETIHEAEKASEESFIDAIASGSYVGILQGVIFAGLKGQGIKKIGEDELTYGLIGKLCGMGETRDNLISFCKAMNPDTEKTKSKSSKNDLAEETEKS